MEVAHIRSKALRRASWDTMADTSKPRRRMNPFSGPRRAFASSVYTDNFVPLALALGYSLTRTNNLHAQNADMVLFVRQGANVSLASLERLRRVGWKVRVEDDIELTGVDVSEIEPSHTWNLNKLRVWSWIEYDQVFFIDADTLVKADLSEVWNTPGGLSMKFSKVNCSDRGSPGRMAKHSQGHSFQLRGAPSPPLNDRIQPAHACPGSTGNASSPRRRSTVPQPHLRVPQFWITIDVQLEFGGV